MLPAVLARIEKRLLVVGLSPSAASLKAGLSKDAIRNMRRAVETSGRQGVSTNTIDKLAPVLRTTSAWLMSEIGPEDVEHDLDDRTDETPAERTVPLVGYVGAGGERHVFAIAHENLDRVPAPDGSGPDTVAVEIRGTSLGSLFDRWLVFYDEIRRPMTDDLIGKLCIVGLPDDRVLIKRVRRSKVGRGLFDLESQTEGTIEGVAITWAAKVKTMAPR